MFVFFIDEHVEGELRKLEELERKHFLEVFFLKEIEFLCVCFGEGKI